MSAERSRRRIKEGVVVSTKMDKTAVVRVVMNYPHPLYGKIISKSKKYYAHDEEASKLAIGEKVRIVECRPFSKLKRYRVLRETK